MTFSAPTRPGRSLGLLSVCVSMWVCVAAQAEPPLAIEVTAACADDRQMEILRDELEFRLEEGAQTEGWRLSWRMEAGRCELALQDAELVMVIPLERAASEESLRNAAMRLAWVMTMEAPRPKPIVEAKESAATESSEAKIDEDLKPTLSWLDRAFVSVDAQPLLESGTPMMLLGGHVGMAFGDRFRLSVGLYETIGDVEETELFGNPEQELVEDKGFFMGRLGVDVNLWSWSIVDLGVYGAVGGAWGGSEVVEDRRGRFDDRRRVDDFREAGRSALFAEVGAQLQIVLSARLSLEAGVGHRWSDGHHETLSEQLTGEVYSVGLRLYWGEVLGDR